MAITSGGFIESKRCFEALTIMAVVIVSIIAILALSSSETSGDASSGKCGDDLEWTLYDDGNLVITGSGRMDDYGRGDAPWYGTRACITSLNVKGASHIGANAFYGCSNLYEAELGDVNSIGTKSFAKCSELTFVRIGNSLTSISSYSFYGCSSLMEIDLIPSVEKLKSIGSYAFYKCDGLYEICIPPSIKTIGTGAFSLDFADLSGNILDKTPEALGGYLYSREDDRLVRQANPEVGSTFEYQNLVYKVTSSLPAEAKVVGYTGVVKNVVVPKYVYSDNFSLKVTSIGNDAFASCKTLRTVDLGNVETIGTKAFYRCTALWKVDIGSAVGIGSKAFASCSALTTVDFGESLKSVGAYAFNNCYALDSIDLPATTVTIGARAFCNCYAMDDVNLGNSLKNIRTYSFANCENIESISFPDSLRSVGDNAFLGLEFKNDSGDAIVPTADSLRSKTFVGTDGVLDTVPSELTVTIVTDSDMGTVDVSSYTVKYGTPLVKDWNVLYVGDYGYTLATPAPPDEGYIYDFYYWDNCPETVTEDVTIVAVFYAISNSYTVYFYDQGMSGTVSVDYIDNIPYGSVLEAVDNMLLINGWPACEATPAPADTQFTYEFIGWDFPGMINGDTTVIAFFNPVPITYSVDIVVEGNGTVDYDHYDVPAGTVLSTEGNVLTVSGYGQTIATPAPSDMQCTYAFDQYVGGDKVVAEDCVVYACFEAYAIPYSVVITYMCDGSPILKHGVDIRVNSQGEWGELFSYNYLDNPKFDEEMASKYTLVKGYLKQPSDPTNQGETVTTTISDTTTVIVFEFSKRGAYVQFHRQGNPIANPVYETPEPYGEIHYAAVSSMMESDADKVIEVLITDPTTGSSVTGNFIGAGESATYNGYTYTVNQLPKITKNGLTYDMVEIVIDGGLNVHDNVNDPLVIWYRLV